METKLDKKVKRRATKQQVADDEIIKWCCKELGVSKKYLSGQDVWYGIYWIIRRFKKND
ncbi:hypothetical protein KAI04_03930 [Candidatus Pacearchaeota archaeon]|nr:hypothetical protein [Candidatus Pacearchaeota archaeon]